MNNNTGRLYIISGPSGSGKDTLISEYLKENSTSHLSISATTRPKREGEKEGQHYFFMTKESFEDLIKNDGLIEYAIYCENYYGTPKEQIEKHIQNGENVILNIEVQGASQLRKRKENAIFVFIMPPSLQVLENRLKARETDTQEAIEKRLRQAETEMKEAEKYDYIIVNDDLKTAVKELTNIINLREV